MRFLVCGEGNSDLGTSEEHPGPLMGAVRWVVGQVLEVAPDLSDAYRFPRKSDVQRALPPKGGKRMALRHTDEDKDVAVFRRQAHALATLANQGADDGVIFFHDCDFTREKVSPAQREARYQAIVCATVPKVGFSVSVAGQRPPASIISRICPGTTKRPTPAKNYWPRRSGAKRAKSIRALPNVHWTGRASKRQASSFSSNGSATWPSASRISPVRPRRRRR